MSVDYQKSPFPFQSGILLLLAEQKSPDAEVKIGGDRLSPIYKGVGSWLVNIEYFPPLLSIEFNDVSMQAFSRVCLLYPTQIQWTLVNRNALFPSCVAQG